MEKITKRWKLLLYGCSGLGVNMLNIIMGSYLCSALMVGGFAPEDVGFWTFTDKDLIIPAVWTFISFFAKALDGIIDLPFANFADNIKSKFGRRKTGIVIGWVPMVVAYCLFALVRITDGASIWNTIWFGVLLCAFYTFYTLTMLTYYATFSEVCINEKDTVFLSNTKSILDVVYFAMGFALLPLFVNMGVNIKWVALAFLPLAFTMIIPMFLLKEKPADANTEIRTLTLKTALKVSIKNRPFMYSTITVAVLNIGLQLFLGGINEVFSSANLNQTLVMVGAFAPVPLTLMLYNKLTKKRGLAFSYRYSILIFSAGMAVLFACSMLSPIISPTILNIVAIVGAVAVSFGIGAFFSVNYTLPTHLARKQFEEKGQDVATMYFAVQGLVEGIAAGIATGVILTVLKDLSAKYSTETFKIIWLLPIIVILAAAGAFVMTYFFGKEVSEIGMVKLDSNKEQLK